MLLRMWAKTWEGPTGRRLFTTGGLLCGLPFAISLFAFSDLATAESLKEAMASAYRNNPTLEATRSDVRAIDENVSFAHGSFRPKIGASGNLNWSNTKVSGGTASVVGPTGNLTQGGTSREASYGVSVTQPIFTGFQLTNQLRIAEAGVRAARAQLSNSERSVLSQTVAAYVSVLSATEALRAGEKNLKQLDMVVRVAKERVALTELTQTDLSQAELARSVATSQIAAARAELQTARVTYVSTVGSEPGRLQDPPLPGGMPKSLTEALTIAEQENPLIIIALYQEEAARHGVELARGQLLPQISVDASWQDSYDGTGIMQRDTSVSGRLTIPLYAGGQISSSVRQAKQMHIGRLQTIEAVRNGVRQAVVTAWAQLEAARTRIKLSTERIRAAEVALAGVRQEEGIGQRTLFDVLVAEQAILDARLASIEARRAFVAAHYEVLSQIGRLNAEHLSLDSLVYDPTVHYHEVRRKWYGLSITHSDGRHERFDARDSEEDRNSLK